MSTALSTLSARVTVLERWMRRSNRQCVVLFVLAIVGLLICMALLAMR